MKFSVIIPVHNAEKTIRRCIESLFNNTYKDFEVIAVEDGSADNSWAVLSELAEEYHALKALKNETNKGVSYTRNRGLEQAAGEYICFTDSDDWVAPDYLQRFAETLTEFPEAFPICGFVNHDEKYNGRCDEYRWNDFEGVKTFPLKEKLEDLHQHTLLQQLWNKAFKADVIRKEQIRFDESISIGEDFRFLLAYLMKAGHEEAALINEALYHYMRDQEGSLMYRVGRESVEEPLKNQRQLLSLIGLPPEQIEERIVEDRAKIIGNYAYLIMHNVGMKRSEKKRLILALDEAKGKELFKQNEVVYIKEKIHRLLFKR